MVPSQGFHRISHLPKNRSFLWGSYSKQTDSAENTFGRVVCSVMGHAHNPSVPALSVLKEKITLFATHLLILKEKGYSCIKRSNRQILSELLLLNQQSKMQQNRTSVHIIIIAYVKSIDFFLPIAAVLLQRKYDRSPTRRHNTIFTLNKHINMVNYAHLLIASTF